MKELDALRAEWYRAQGQIAGYIVGMFRDRGGFSLCSEDIDRLRSLVNSYEQADKALLNFRVS